jgi:tRNA nucleotidyltransferase/poly(A) polymerase
MGIQLFEVGGSIRDEVMGLPSNDRDFCAVSPRGWASLVSWSNKKMKVFKIVPEFFTIRGNLGNDVIDIVMCRKDSAESDGRRPNSVEPGTLQDDLARRDFTVNAMAREVDKDTLVPISGIVDPFGGSIHARLAQLHPVGSAQERFNEDNLRLIRAVRFAVTKSMTLDPNLEQLVSNPHNWESMMTNVSTERVREELTKMFIKSGPAALRFMSHNLPSVAFDHLFGGQLWLKPTLEKRKR